MVAKASTLLSASGCLWCALTALASGLAAGQEVAVESAETVSPAPVISSNRSDQAFASEVNCWTSQPPWYCRFIEHMRSTHWGYPEYFQEPPFGCFMRAYIEPQVLNGTTRQMVLYEYDFVDASGGASDKLNSRGRDQLRRLARMIERTGQPIVIAESENRSSLNEARRQFVLTQLQELGIPATPESVVVGREPIFGIGAPGERDAPGQSNWNVTYQNRLQQTREQGSRRILPQTLRAQ